jgi:hypothetical protein
MTLKKIIYDILLVDQGCRNSDKKLIWEVYRQLGFVDHYLDTLTKEKFFKAPSPESCRRVRQSLQRTDLLTGTKLIQPAEQVKKARVNMAKEKGYNYMQGKAVFNPVTCTYEIN